MSYHHLVFSTMIYDGLCTCLSPPLFRELSGCVPPTRKMPDTGKEGNEHFFNGGVEEKVGACMYLPPKANVRLSDKQDEVCLGTPSHITSYDPVCLRVTDNSHRPGPTFPIQPLWPQSLKLPSVLPDTLSSFISHLQHKLHYQASPCLSCYHILSSSLSSHVLLN